MPLPLSMGRSSQVIYYESDYLWNELLKYQKKPFFDKGKFSLATHKSLLLGFKSKLYTPRSPGTLWVSTIFYCRTYICFLDLEVKCNITLGDFVGVFRTKKACSPTSDAECECVAGFHCLGTGCRMCEQDCQQGQELAKEGRCARLRSSSISPSRHRSSA